MVKLSPVMPAICHLVLWQVSRFTSWFNCPLEFNQKYNEYTYIVVSKLSRIQVCWLHYINVKYMCTISSQSIDKWNVFFQQPFLVIQQENTKAPNVLTLCKWIPPGGRLNKTILSYRFRYSHYNDKIVSRQSKLVMEIFIPRNTVFVSYVSNTSIHGTHGQLDVRLQYLKCIGNLDTAGLH